MVRKMSTNVHKCTVPRVCTYQVKPHSGKVPAKGRCCVAGIPGASCKVIELYGLRTLFLSIGSFVPGPGITSTRSISVAPLPFPILRDEFRKKLKKVKTITCYQHK
jgi:hypothetical protein